MSIGYVGLGNMGGALARRLALTHPLRVFDLRPEAMQALAEQNCTPVQSAAALGAECGTVLTCLPTSDHVRQAVFGPGGLPRAWPRAASSSTRRPATRTRRAPWRRNSRSAASG